MSTFRDLGVRAETADALEAVGIVSPFPIQSMTLPLALTGNDVIGQAKTGTGKTLGFGIPIIDNVVCPSDEAASTTPYLGKPQALVVVPTRELCVQVAGDLEAARGARGVRILAVYGGRAYEPQVEALERGVDVVVGTPGRLIDLARQGKLDLHQVRTLVLDEADEMLDLGFLPDVERIVAQVRPERQTMLFSATMPGPIIALARRYMDQPTHIRAADPDDVGQTVANTEQHVFRAHAMDKVEMLARLLQAEARGLTIVFCRTKRTAAKVADDLVDRGFAAAAVHGDLGQGAREQALRAFRSGKVDVLVATDVAARGIDVEDVTHVVNFQCPEDEKTYLHRIGRTGRAGKSGVAVTFVDWDDIPRWTLINKALELPFDAPPETYSTSPHFFTQLRIPTNVTGVLPRAARTRAGLAAEEVEDIGETGRVHAKHPHGAAVKSAPGRRPHGASRPTDDEVPRTVRPKRARTRMRSGVPLDGADGAGSGDAGASRAGSADAGGGRVDADGTPAARTAAVDGEASGTTTRRRRRGGRGRGGAVATTEQAPAEG